jgi:hypothetical protein
MRVFFATPVHAACHPLHVRSLLGMLRHLCAAGHSCVHAMTLGLPVAEAREELFTQFLQSGADWLCMGDDDIGFEEDLVERMSGLGEQLVCAAVPVRRYDPARAAISGVPSEGLYFAGPGDMDRARLLEKRIGRQSGRDHFLPAPLGSTALMCLGRPGAEKIAAAHPGGVFRPMTREGSNLGEDLSFFARWRDLGETIWVLTSSTVTHSGPITVCGNLDLALSDPAKHPAVLRSWPYEEHSAPGDLPRENP